MTYISKYRKDFNRKNLLQNREIVSRVKELVASIDKEASKTKLSLLRELSKREKATKKAVKNAGKSKFIKSFE